MRYITFIQSLRKNPRPAVIYLLEKVQNNLNTVTSRNIRNVLTETGFDDILYIKINEIKRNYRFCDTDQNDEWKINFVRELVNIRQNVLELKDNILTEEELDEILACVTTS